MADSLREQLVQAGLATREQADRATKPKSHKKKKAQPKAAGKGQRKPDRRRQKAGERKPNPQRRDTRRPEAGAEDLELIKRRKVKAEIKALIDAASVKDFTGEISFNFMIGERIRQLFVNESAHKSIVAGELAITRLNRETHLIPPDVAEQVKALNPNWLIVLSGEASGESEPSSDPDDPYTAYTVPDDLRW